MSVAEQFGISEDDLAGAGAVKYPPEVAGRIAHIDADFMAYQCAAEKKEELDGTQPRRTFVEMCEQAKNSLNHHMRLAGAESYVAHLTPSGSNKGGRFEQSITLPYQGNRIDKEKPEHLDQLRHWIGTHLPARVHIDQEADDGMAQANYKALDPLNDAGVQSSVIVSRDKDLRMVPGLHYDFKDETVIYLADNFGYIEIDESGSAKKVVGYGTKFFWAQLLMGDAADNIKGLPFVTQRFLFNELGRANKMYDRLLNDAQNLMNTSITEFERVSMIIEEIDNKLKPCGPVMAEEMLRCCANDQACYKMIKARFVELDEHPSYEFINHHTQEPCTGTQALFGDMQTLWMRRTKDPLDVLAWLKERKVL